METTNRQIAGHLLVECLAAQGVTHAFGVPGESFLAVLDGFHAYRDRIRFITARHEGGASFMAEAAGKLTGRPGVCFVTRGPGATNASIGIHTAYQDSTPMVLFVGDVGSDFRDREAFQELDFRTFFGPTTGGMAKRVERIDSPERLPEYIARAFATAMNGRAGPVVLVLPEDMLTQMVSSRPLPRVSPVAAAITANDLSRLRELLVAAKRPLVIAGGSGWSVASAKALQRFAENWSLPVVNDFRCQDVFDNHHPQYAGDAGIAINPKLAQRIRDSDLVIALGARLGEMMTSGYSLLEVARPHQKLIHIYPGAEELNRVYQADLPILATVDAACTALEAIQASPSCTWLESTREAHKEYEANFERHSLPGQVDMHQVLALISKHLPADAVLTNGAGNFATWLHRYHRYHGLVKGVKTQLAPVSGAMGYGVPSAVAASLVTGRSAFTLAGDGDFMMNGQELATAAQYGGKTIVVIVNNGMLGTIRMHQEREFPTHETATRLVNPDFAALARAYGYAGERVEKTDQFEAAFLAALARREGTVIDVVIDPEALTTRGTLSAIRDAALKRQAASA
ncbi:MAG: thiamine pyrophosphate-binding protein [Ramlibacter sp.]|uniref:thiamine pyrophosphate-binding protein n=1 Tax=Ramlibacter sp. TaxID=1917967 RepID=UPI00261E2B83|nr:thiamine pyrophosphate-binding protein [Ramlibacter sp.]MDH4377970.1 thiamine pyrophosphate-binding protein [Ramlibacter sp.]